MAALTDLSWIPSSVTPANMLLALSALFGYHVYLGIYRSSYPWRLGVGFCSCK